MANEVNPENLQRITHEMVTAISSPAFVKAMKTMKDTPVEDRLAVAKQVLAPEKLRADGVPLPEGMRISSRYFEPGESQAITVDDEGANTDDNGASANALGGGKKIGAWGCACGGAATVCGGAGGGSDDGGPRQVN